MGRRHFSPERVKTTGGSMSLFYGMSVDVSGNRPEATDAIKDAATSEWPFGDWTEVNKKLSAYGEGRLGGGETEREFTERLSVAIWRANGAFCDVSVSATYLEDLPSETYSLDEDDYARLIQGTAETLPTEEGKEGEDGENEVVPGD
jgi:hypothetical protein